MSVILVANIALYVLKRIPELWFWAVIIIFALYAYKVLPKIREKIK